MSAWYCVNFLTLYKNYIFKNAWFCHSFLDFSLKVYLTNLFQFICRKWETTNKTGSPPYTYLKFFELLEKCMKIILFRAQFVFSSRILKNSTKISNLQADVLEIYKSTIYHQHYVFAVTERHGHLISSLAWQHTVVSLRRSEVRIFLSYTSVAPTFEFNTFFLYLNRFFSFPGSTTSFMKILPTFESVEEIMSIT